MEVKHDPVNQQTVINQHNPEPSPLSAADLSRAAFSCHIQTQGERGKNRNSQPPKPKRELVNVTQINTVQGGILESAESLKHLLMPPPPPWLAGGGWGAAAAPHCPPKTAPASSLAVSCWILAQELESRGQDGRGTVKHL